MEKFVTQLRLSGTNTFERPHNLKTAIEELVQDESGRLLEIYPILGDQNTDLVVVCNFPTVIAATKAWMALGDRYGWRTQTNPSPEFEQFEQVYGQIHGVAAGAGSPTSSSTRSR